MGMVTKLFALMAVLIFFATDVKPAQAAATFKPVEVDSEYSDIVEVGRRRAGRNFRRSSGRRHYRSGRSGRNYRRSARRDYRRSGRRHNRSDRRRYRRYRGRDIGIGIGIGVGSAVIGGVINDTFYRSRRYYDDGLYYSAPRTYRTRTRRVRRSSRSNSDSHVGWCARRYRSYSVRSDTYQPYNGGRRRCNSPYN